MVYLILLNTECGISQEIDTRKLESWDNIVEAHTRGN